MLIATIILAIIAAVCCTIAAAYSFIAEKYASGIFMIGLVILNICTFAHNLNKYLAKRNRELKTEIVKNVVKYDVDSTIVINGADTTKTYTLTYLKKYE